MAGAAIVARVASCDRGACGRHALRPPLSCSVKLDDVGAQKLGVASVMRGDEHAGPAFALAHQCRRGIARAVV